MRGPAAFACAGGSRPAAQGNSGAAGAAALGGGRSVVRGGAGRAEGAGGTGAGLGGGAARGSAGRRVRRGDGRRAVRRSRRRRERSERRVRMRRPPPGSAATVGSRSAGGGFGTVVDGRAVVLPAAFSGAGARAGPGVGGLEAGTVPGPPVGLDRPRPAVGSPGAAAGSPSGASRPPVSCGHEMTMPAARMRAAARATFPQRIRASRRGGGGGGTSGLMPVGGRWPERFAPLLWSAAASPEAPLAMPATLSYDLTLLLDTAVEPERRAEILRDVESGIQAQGSLLKGEDWGVRQLTYEIRHKTDAEYHFLQFTGPRELLDSLGHSLRITDGVVRFRIIKRLRGTPEAPAPPRQERPAAQPAATPAASAAPAPS